MGYFANQHLLISQSLEVILDLANWLIGKNFPLTMSFSFFLIFKKF